jgi:cobalt/nickel transport system permease protein
VTRDRFAGLDPRVRLLAALALVAATVALDRPATLAVAVAGAAALALAAGWRAGALARRLLHVEGIVAAFLLILPFATPGAPVAPLGPLSPTAEGLALAVTLGLRVTAASLVALALLAPAEPARLGQGLLALGVPERLARLFLLVARHVGLIRDELNRAGEAMRARGFRGGLSRHALRSYGRLVGMTLVRALDRAERVEEAMRLRGFRGLHPARALGPPGARDLGTLAAALGAGLAAVAADRLG